MLNVIEQNLPGLSRAEQRVARWVLAHPHEAANAKLAAVAAACDTSEPTVIRFCRHLGLTGFRQFTIRLTEALSRPAVYVHRSVSADDSTVDAVAKVMDASIRALIDVRARASSMPFDAAVNAFATARQLAFVGSGASGRVADDAHQKFFRLGIPCCALTDTPTQLQFAAAVEPGDVLILISGGGETTATVQAAQTARRNGALTVGVTSPLSSLAQAVDHCFECHVSDDMALYTPQSSRLAHLALLDALQVALALKLGDAAVERLRRSKQALEAWRNPTP